MTAGRFGEVDHDLLADYVGGALAGTPDEVAVARLVAEDPAWAREHAALTAALEQVSNTLAAWGEATPAMPQDVADRLTAALAGAGPVVPTQPNPAGAGMGAGAGSSGIETGRTVAVVGTTPGRAHGVDPRRRRRRWARRTGPVVLVATAAMVAAGFGVTQLIGLRAADRGNDGTTATAERSTATDRFRLTTTPIHTGISYTPESVGAVPGPSVFSAKPEEPVKPNMEADERRPEPDVALDRLANQAALDACLDAVGTAHGRGPITVDRVEYAAFQGSPALVIGLVDAAGHRWVVVTGPECGVPGSGADTRYQSRVG